MLYGRAQGALLVRAWIFVSQRGIPLFELSHLSVGTPFQVCEPGVPEVSPGNPVKATTGVEGRGYLQRKSLVVDEAAVVRGGAGSFVEPRGIGTQRLWR